MERGPLSPSRGSSDGLDASETNEATVEKWRRIYLLVIAITLHNMPEGMAVGVAYGSVGGTGEAAAAQGAYGGARSLAIGIALQNFPEGLAVSMPLRREGMSYGQAFFWGQLSGAVEPLGGLLGAYAVTFAAPLLPLSMAFAAGAMIYVVVDQLIPEAHAGSPKHSTAGFVIGFALMMALDLAA